LFDSNGGSDVLIETAHAVDAADLLDQLIPDQTTRIGRSRINLAGR
jgi:hypothetical protein